MRSMIRVAVATALLAATLSVVGGEASFAASTCPGGWVQGEPPTIGSDTYLNAVSVLSPCNAWAVGQSSVGTVAEQWTGSRWISIASPNPGGSNSAGLRGVSALSRNNAWAVGTYSAGAVSTAFTEHWVANSWSVVAAKNPGTTANDLSSVSAVSASDVWAVGSTTSGTHVHALIEHWNGTSWKVSAVPPTTTATENQRLLSVVATSANNAWAVGFRYDGPMGKTLVLHWNGATWKVQKSANPDDAGSNTNNSLLAVDATSANNAWAVGDYDDASTGHQQPLIERWDGTSWKAQAAPKLSEVYPALNGVATTSAGNVWAVGQREGSSPHYQTLIVHWDGAAWSVVNSPNPGGAARNNYLYGVAAASSSDLWAVGEYADSDQITRPLAAHCC